MTGKIISRKSELTENYYYENLKKKSFFVYPTATAINPRRGFKLQKYQIM